MMEVEVLEKKSLSSLYSEVTFIQGQVKANLEMQLHLKKEEMKLQDMRADLEKEIVGLQKMTRLLKLVERVEEDLDIFLNDKSMTNEQAFKEIGAKT